MSNRLMQSVLLNDRAAFDEELRALSRRGSIHEMIDFCSEEAPLPYKQRKDRFAGDVVLQVIHYGSVDDIDNDALWNLFMGRFLGTPVDERVMEAIHSLVDKRPELLSSLRCPSRCNLLVLGKVFFEALKCILPSAAMRAAFAYSRLKPIYRAEAIRVDLGGDSPSIFIRRRYDPDEKLMYTETDWDVSYLSAFVLHFKLKECMRCAGVGGDWKDGVYSQGTCSACGKQCNGNWWEA